ncbi:hypothetical protein [Alicyclobacillus pomorum]|nr:hypothetical protein [Alicyclobacillus pomorum]
MRRLARRVHDIVGCIDKSGVRELSGVSHLLAESAYQFRKFLWC